LIASASVSLERLYLRRKRPRELIKRTLGCRAALNADHRQSAIRLDDVVEDQEMILVELSERIFEREFAARDLQALDEVGGAHEQRAPSVLDERKPDGCGKMALASAGRAKEQEIGAPLNPAIASGERHHLRPADHWHCLEVEVGECFADGQSCFGQVAFDAATTAIGDLVFGECGREASAFFVYGIATSAAAFKTETATLIFGLFFLAYGLIFCYLFVDLGIWSQREAMAKRRDGVALDRRLKAYKHLPVLRAALAAHQSKYVIQRVEHDANAA